MTKVLTRARRHWRLRSATALAAVGALAATGGLVVLTTSSAAIADGQEHVFVCKYVGTPKVDERLKSGKQPIRVAAPATTEDGWFNDAQGRSFVLDESTELNTGPGNEYLGDKVCPAPDNPDGGKLIDLPDVQVDDPCGPANATWVLPADDTTFAWVIDGTGNLIVTIKTDAFFPGRETTHNYGLAQDSGEPCYIVPPGAPSTTDPCDPSNVYFNIPPDTTQLNYTLLPNGNVTVEPIAPYAFTGATQLVTFTLPADSGELCGVVPPPPPPPAALEEVVPTVTFTDPTCENLDGAGWEGSLEAVLDYEATGVVGAGETIEVEATIETGLTDEYEFADEAQTVFTHTFDDVTLEDCVEGEETVVPKPTPDKPEQPGKKPTVAGVQVVAPPAAAPTAVAAGIGGQAGTGSVQLVGQSLTGAGLLTLVAAGWLLLSRRARGVHES
jgi:hypothetical protein